MDRIRNARILSVASGHLRELDVVRSTVRQRDFEIIALDQDGDSLQEAVNSNPGFNIYPVNKSISYLRSRRTGIEQRSKFRMRERNQITDLVSSTLRK